MTTQLDEVAAAVAALDEKRALEAVRKALETAESVIPVVRAAEEGMRRVGERYSREEIYLSGLIMAGEIFYQIMNLAGPGLEKELAGNASGTVLLGTVQGDIHDIGKNIAGLAFRTYGFTVHDLGVNVPPKCFLEAAIAIQPDVIGMSGLVSPAFVSMRETTLLLKEYYKHAVRKPIIVIGGGTIDEEVHRYVGADYWTNDAMRGVIVCQHALEEKHKKMRDS